MVDIFCYTVNLPDGINEMVVPCYEGYTVYVNINLDVVDRRKALRHAIRHIHYRDFEKGNVQSIERNAHGDG